MADAGEVRIKVKVDQTELDEALAKARELRALLDSDRADVVQIVDKALSVHDEKLVGELRSRGLTTRSGGLIR